MRRGQVVGEGYTTSGELHAFLWQDGTMTDLGNLRNELERSDVRQSSAVPSPSTTRGFPAKSIGGRLGTDRVPASIAGEVGRSWKLRLETNCGSTEMFPLSPV
jgi:probable HAF family extracellular repeat protein